jgi:hypothetical protein
LNVHAPFSWSCVGCHRHYRVDDTQFPERRLSDALDIGLVHRTSDPER